MKKKFNLVELVDILTEHFGKTAEDFLDQLYTEGITSRLLHYVTLIQSLNNPNFSDLARVMNISKPSVTAAVDKLTAKGYIRKVQSDEDRRSFHLHLTGKGEKLVQLHDETHRENALHIEQTLTPDEVETLVKLLNKVVSRLS